MRVTRCVLAATMVYLAAAVAPARAMAQASSPDDGPTDGSFVYPDDPGMDRWWGTGGAMICGVGLRIIRVAPVLGAHPAVLAPTIGGCALAALDILTTK